MNRLDCLFRLTIWLYKAEFSAQKTGVWTRKKNRQWKTPESYNTIKFKIYENAEISKIYKAEPWAHGFEWKILLKIVGIKVRRFFLVFRFFMGYNKSTWFGCVCSGQRVWSFHNKNISKKPGCKKLVCQSWGTFRVFVESGLKSREQEDTCRCHFFGFQA